MVLEIKHATEAVGQEAGNGEIGKSEWNEPHQLHMGGGRLVGRAASGQGPAAEVSLATSIVWVGSSIAFNEVWGDARYATLEQVQEAPGFNVTAMQINAWDSSASDVAAGSANWDAAYGWGNHALAGYLTSETDPVFSGSAAAGIVTGDIINWNAAYGWGDHSSEGYYSAANKASVANIRALAGTGPIVSGDVRTAIGFTTQSGAGAVTVNMTDNVNHRITVSGNAEIAPSALATAVGKTVLLDIIGNDATLREVTWTGAFIGNIRTLTDVTSTKGYYVTCHVRDASNVVVMGYVGYEL